MKILYFCEVESGAASEWRAAVLALSLIHNADVAPVHINLRITDKTSAAFSDFAADHGVTTIMYNSVANYENYDRLVLCESDVYVLGPLPVAVLEAPSAAADGAFRVLDPARPNSPAIPLRQTSFLRYGERMDVRGLLHPEADFIDANSRLRKTITSRVLSDFTLFRLFEAWQAACAPVTPERASAAREAFRNIRYLRHNARRLEHLASIGLDLEGKSVVEFGAGIGDHSQFFLDRGCHVVAIEPRAENVACLRARYVNEQIVFPRARHLVIQADAESAAAILGEVKFQVVHNYGLLYHLEQPDEFLRRSAVYCEGLYLLETAVSDLTERETEFTEDPQNYTHAVDGRCRLLSRQRIFDILRESLPYAYMPTTQPAHEQFLRDWSAPPAPRPYRHRAVFIASTTPLTLPGLADHVLTRHD